MKKLLIYSHYFWPSVGGVETYARLAAEGLSGNDDFEVTIVTETPHAGAGSEYKFTVVRKPSTVRLWNLISGTDMVLLAGPALAPMVFALLARTPFVIEHHGYQATCLNGLLLNKARGGVCGDAFLRGQYSECLRCFAAEHGVLQAIKQLVLTFLRRWLCSKASAQIAISSHVRNRIRLERTEVIYYGVPNSRCVTTKLNAWQCKRTHFAYIGRLVEEKGLPLLLQAAAGLSQRGVDYELSFIGDGPLRRSLVAHAQSLQLDGRVRFTGFLEGPDLQRAAEAVDVVVMPSIWEETAGLSAMEQMMRGRAVLAADIGGLGEIVGDGGVKFRPNDVEDLAAKMLQLTNPGYRVTIGKAARERANRLFGLQRMIAEHKAVIMEAGHAR